MATKNISITEEAYIRLASLRKRNESFSEIIVNNVIKKSRLKELYGILSGIRGERLEKSIEEGRRLHREMHKKRTERILKELE